MVEGHGKLRREKSVSAIRLPTWLKDILIPTVIVIGIPTVPIVAGMVWVGYMFIDAQRLLLGKDDVYLPRCVSRNVPLIADYHGAMIQALTMSDIPFKRVGHGFLVPRKRRAPFSAEYRDPLATQRFEQRITRSLLALTTPGQITPLGYVYRRPDKLPIDRDTWSIPMEDCDLVDSIVMAKHWRPATAEEQTRRALASKSK